MIFFSFFLLIILLYGTMSLESLFFASIFALKCFVHRISSVCYALWIYLVFCCCCCCWYFSLDLHLRHTYEFWIAGNLNYVCVCVWLASFLFLNIAKEKTFLSLSLTYHYSSSCFFFFNIKPEGNGLKWKKEIAKEKKIHSNSP